MSQATITAGPYRNSDLFSGYYLEERIDDRDAWDCDAEAEAVFEELQTLWKNEGELVAGSNEDTLLGSWIDPVLDALGYDMLQETPLPETGGFIDRVLYDDAADRREAMGMKQSGQLASALSRSSALLEAKQWDTDFAQRFSEQRSYRDASHQVKYYLEHTPESLQWGILTDGKKWRLYGTKDYATETYYEVDLPELLAQDDLDAFKYFYLFFRPEAFREIAGTSFLETVWSESETAAQELGEDLQDNVFTALRVLGEGFVESNDLGIDPAQEELKEQSLVLLYRLMFVFYAESRGLIHPDDPNAEDDYRENFSLEQLRDDVVNQIDEGETFEDFSEYSTQMWDRLQRLFDLIDAGEEALGIPAYNGGLFDNDDHSFLAEHDVTNRYVAEVVYRLGTTENDEGEDVTADYADLDTRHLGTIYEGLLEHEFRIADEQYAAVAEDGGQVWKPATEVSAAEFVEIVEEGELYVVNDDGERKATGAYYTPDYVVSYIVEETVDPLLEEIHEELEADGLDQSDQAYFGRFYGAVQDLTILDPAMGSGHFLTKATGYLTEQVMEVVREQERMGRDEQQLRRTISRECIYGVDINGMATELAKLSMWLETLATDQPLAFLDHHLKAGNSLVGSDITDVLSTSDSTGTEQATLFDDFSRTRRQALEHVMGLLEDLMDIENETVADAKAMEELYEEIRSDNLYERLFGIANVHTAERFGLDLPVERDVYKQMADAIDDDEAWSEIEGRDWYTTAQATAAEEGFFHWELEYPEVFFSEDGERGEDAGFDVVVGNPPYARIPAEMADGIYPDISNDLYTQFIALSSDICRDGGVLSYITPTSWETGPDYSPIRERLFSKGHLRSILNLPYDVFDDAYVDTGVFVWQKGLSEEKCLTADLSGTRIDPALAIQNSEFTPIATDYWDELGFVALNKNWISMYERIGDNPTLGEITESTRGVLVTKASKNADETDTAICLDSFERFERISADAEVKWDLLDEAPPSKDIFDGARLLIRRLVSRSDRLLGTFSSDFFVSKKDVYIFKSDSYDERFLLSLANSSLLSWWHFNVEMSASKDDFRQVTLGGLRDLPLPEMSSSEGDPTNYTQTVLEYVDGQISSEEVKKSADMGRSADSEIQSLLSDCGGVLIDLNERYDRLNLDLVQYFGNFGFNKLLPEMGFYQPAANPDSILHEASEDNDEHLRIRIGDIRANRQGANSVQIEATARYRPDEGEDFVETDYRPAFRLTDLSETEADLIESFIPIADDVDGAGFRTNATKTNSLMDRIEDITLPAVDDVADGLERYIETKERADELEEKIQRTDELIDEIVYELYGLTDGEIEIVEDVVGE